MLVASPARAADASLGRLFFTPAERQALEEARRKNVRAEVQATEKPARPPVRNVTVSGVVRRSDGESTVWVNGKPVDGATADGLKVRVTAGQQAAVIVHEPAQGHTLRLKVGQRADILTGRIEEGYERRQAAAPQAALARTHPAARQASCGARERGARERAGPSGPGRWRNTQRRRQGWARLSFAAPACDGCRRTQQGAALLITLVLVGVLAALAGVWVVNSGATEGAARAGHRPCDGHDP